MRDDDQGCPARKNMIGQPLHTLNIEVVRWLIENEQIQISDQCGRQVNATALTTGEIGDLGIHTEVIDTDAIEDLADGSVTRPLVFSESQRCNDALKHGGIRVELGALGDMRHGHVVGSRNTSGVRWLHACQNLQQCGLAATVQTDNADAVALLNTEADAVEQSLEPEGLRNILAINQIRHDEYLLCPIRRCQAHAEHTKPPAAPRTALGLPI